jgi:hypothetical protein
MELEMYIFKTIFVALRRGSGGYSPSLDPSYQVKNKFKTKLSLFISTLLPYNDDSVTRNSKAIGFCI